jgi:hypothetical protein
MTFQHPQYLIETDRPPYNAQRTRESEANRTTRDLCIQERLCVIQHDIACTEEDPS